METVGRDIEFTRPRYRPKNHFRFGKFGRICKMCEYPSKSCRCELHVALAAITKLNM